MTGQTFTHRRLEYWKDVQLELWASFKIVPVQTISSEQPFFEQIVEEVKKAGFKYRLIEVIETIKDQL